MSLVSTSAADIDKYPHWNILTQIRNLEQRKADAQNLVEVKAFEKEIEEKEGSIYDRLIKEYETTAGMAGFIGGFTYIVGNLDVSFNDSVSLYSNDVRKEIYGVLVTGAFFFALLSAILSSALMIMVQISGKKNMIWFVEKFYFQSTIGPFSILDLPWQLWNGCVFFLLASIIVSVGGFYKMGTFIAIMVLFVVLISIGYGSYFYVKSKVYEKLKNP